jgi:hypothetical protein
MIGLLFVVGGSGYPENESDCGKRPWTCETILERSSPLVVSETLIFLSTSVERKINFLWTTEGRRSL